MTDLERLSAVLERFPTDARGRMLSGAGDGCPHFLFARTRHGTLWRFRSDLPEPLVRDLARLAGREPPLDRDPSTAASPERLEPMRRCLAEAGIGVGIERSLDGEPEPYAELFRFG